MTSSLQTLPDLIQTGDAATLLDVARQLIEAAQPKAGIDSAHVLAQTLNSLSDAECLLVDEQEREDEAEALAFLRGVIAR